MTPSWSRAQTCDSLVLPPGVGEATTNGLHIVDTRARLSTGRCPQRKRGQLRPRTRNKVQDHSKTRSLDRISWKCWLWPCVPAGMSAVTAACDSRRLCNPREGRSHPSQDNSGRLHTDILVAIANPKPTYLDCGEHSDATVPHAERQVSSGGRCRSKWAPFTVIWGLRQVVSRERVAPDSSPRLSRAPTLS